MLDSDSFECEEMDGVPEDMLVYARYTCSTLW
jgi:hypothetical protein